MPGPAEMKVNTNKRGKKGKTKHITDPNKDQHLTLRMTVCFPLLLPLLEARQIQAPKMIPRDKLREREDRKGIKGEKKERCILRCPSFCLATEMFPFLSAFPFRKKDETSRKRKRKKGGNHHMLLPSQGDQDAEPSSVKPAETSKSRGNKVSLTLPPASSKRSSHPL